MKAINQLSIIILISAITFSAGLYLGNAKGNAADPIGAVKQRNSESAALRKILRSGGDVAGESAYEDLVEIAGKFPLETETTVYNALNSHISARSSGSPNRGLFYEISELREDTEVFTTVGYSLDDYITDYDRRQAEIAENTAKSKRENAH